MLWWSAGFPSRTTISCLVETPIRMGAKRLAGSKREFWKGDGVDNQSPAATQLVRTMQKINRRPTFTVDRCLDIWFTEGFVNDLPVFWFLESSIANDHSEVED